MVFFVEHVAHFVSIWEVITLREIILEKLVGMLVLLTCMLWAAAEKPYHDRVGSDPRKPDCTGTYLGVSCRVDPKYEGLLDPQCHHEDEVWIENSGIRIRVEANDYACTGIMYKGNKYRHCKPSEGKRPDDYCNPK